MPKKRGRAGKGEGTITERKDGRFQVQITIAPGKRKTLYGKTREEAQEKRLKALNELKQGKLATGPQQTVKQFLEDWLENIHKPLIRENSYTLYYHLIKDHLVPALGNIKLQNLTAYRVQTLYSSELKKGYAVETVRAIHRMLHKALDDAVRWKRLSHNVCDDVNQPQSVEYEIHPLSKYQAKMLMKVARNTPIEALITLALATGMRRGELLGLKWQDIDFEEKSLSIRRTVYRIEKIGVIESDPKTAKSKRKILLPEFVVAALLEHRERQAIMRKEAGQTWQEADIVFTSNNGKYMEAQHLTRRFKRLLKKAGLPDMRFHDLRHSAATILLEMGVHPKQVQELLGHSTIAMTMDRYSHVQPSMQRKMMNDLDGYFGEE